MMQNINAFDLFKQQLETDDLAVRVNTIHRISIVATLMSPETIKSNLLPFLDSLTKKEDDEVVFAIAEQYASIAPFLNNQHPHILVYLENLCTHDETVVRERAVKSITKLLDLYNQNQIGNYILPLIMRLANNEANFTYRVSATLLMCNVYHKAGVHKEKIRQKFTDISNEEMLLLQRVTASKISHLCKVYEKQYVLSDLISILKHRSTDEQDQIRVLATQSFKQIAKILTKDENKTFIMPLIIQAAEDKSWRVRLCLSRNFTQISSSFGKEVTDLSLIQTYSNLLKDSEFDVKIQAVKHLSGFVKIVASDKISVILPNIIALGKDQLASVRSYVGGILKNMLASISKDQSYQSVQPLIKDLIKDDNQQVRKGGIQAATKFIQILGVETVNALNQSLKTIIDDNKWRVRLELIKSLAELAVEVQNYEMFSKYIEPLYVFYLKDRASAIRVEAISHLQKFAKVYGINWVNSFIIRMTEIIQKDSCYHFKIAAIYSLKQLIFSVHGGGILDKVIGVIIQAANNPVANVREVCVKTFRDIAIRYQKSSSRQTIKKHIFSMTEDSDFEVKYSALQALQKL